MKQMLLPIIFILGLPLYPYAGVQSVGNGGGYGEMLAYLANQNIHLIASYCRLTKSCNLSSQDEALFQNAISLPLKMEISTKCFDAEIEIVSHTAQVRYSACGLYDETSDGKIRVRDFHHIARLLMIGRLMFLGLPRDEATELSHRGILPFEDHHEAVQLSLESGQVIFHLLRVRMGEKSFLVPSLEGKKHTVSLKEHIEELFQCDGGLDFWQTSELNSEVVSSSEGLAEMKVLWRCQNGAVWTAKTQIFFRLIDEDISEKDLIVEIVQKKRIE